MFYVKNLFTDDEDDEGVAYRILCGRNNQVVMNQNGRYEFDKGRQRVVSVRKSDLAIGICDFDIRRNEANPIDAHVLR